jgi:hypothetical protein
MANEETAAGSEGTQDGQVTGQTDEQSTELEGQTGETEAGQVQDGEEQAAAGSPDVETLKKSYKELQAEFTKRTQKQAELEASLKQLDAYGGIDNLVQSIQYMRSDPDFQKYVLSKQQKNELGVDTTDMDNETKEALGLVDKIATQLWNK